MPAELIEDPLGLLFVSAARRSSKTFEFGQTSNPVLAAQMLVGLRELIHPHGRVDEAKTVGQYVTAIRKGVEELTALGHTGGAAGLTRVLLAQYWMAAGYSREYKTRRVIAAMDDAIGILRPDVRELARGRHFNGQRRRDKRPSKPFTETEWERLQQACRATIRTSFTDHRCALAAAERGADPVTGGWTPDNLRWFLRRSGPITQTRLQRAFGHGVVGRVGDDLLRASAALFVDTDVALAYRLLFGTYTGIVPDGIEHLEVGDLDWAGDATVLLNYLKGRAAQESVTLNRRAVRLLEQWLDHSALTRATLEPERRSLLWVHYSPGRYGRPMTKEIGTATVTAWAKRRAEPGPGGSPALVDDDGATLLPNRRRIRTTYHSLRDRRAWFGSGRATIDPNHTPQIEGDNYLTASTPAQVQALETIIESAQTDLLRRALPPVVVTTDQAAELADRFPQMIGELDLSDSTVAELVSTSHRDTFAAACSDPLSGLHGPPGKPCPARPWVCLLCPLSIFTPRHAVNLLRLQAFFGRQWRQMPSAQYMAVFGPYAQRIEEILAVFRDRAPAVLEQAAHAVADTDADLPLLPEERTD